MRVQREPRFCERPAGKDIGIVPASDGGRQRGWQVSDGGRRGGQTV